TEIAQGTDRVGKRQPRTQRINESVLLGRRRFESQAFRQACGYFAQDVAVRLVLSSFSFSLEFAIDLEQIRARQIDRMLLQDWAQRGENPPLPVNESPVAIEGDELEPGEVQHKEGSV